MIAIDAAYMQIEALGGYVAPDDTVGRARAEQLDEILNILERNGAWDRFRVAAFESDLRDVVERRVDQIRHDAFTFKKLGDVAAIVVSDVFASDPKIARLVPRYPTKKESV